jgi:uncharacterized protein (DUF2164 family)
MKKNIRVWDNLTEIERNKCLSSIAAYYLDERDEQIDIIASNDLLDMFLRDIAPIIYNKAIDDANLVVRSTLEKASFELEVIKK